MSKCECKGLNALLMSEEPEVVNELNTEEVCPNCPVYKFKDITKDIRENCKDRDLIISRIQSLNLDLMDLKTKYILIGGHLIDLIPYCKDVWSFKKARYCKNIYELAEHCFNLPKTTTVNIISVTKKFGYLMNSLKKDYEEYSFSQLTEMVSLSDEQLALVNPEMSVQDIRAMKKANKKVGPTSDQTQDCTKVESFIQFKNDNERSDFIKNYEYWGLWLEFHELNLKFYKCELSNGDFLVATAYKSFISKNDINYQYLKNEKASYVINIIRRGTCPTHYGYFPNGDSLNNVIDYIRKNSIKVAVPFKCKDFQDYKRINEEIREKENAK